MRICIVGSRSVKDPAVVFPLIENFIREQSVGQPVILSGGAIGVDALVKKWADVRGFDFIEFLPYHLIDKGVEFSSRYFFSRNRQMIHSSDRVLAIWDGESTGTLHTIRYSQKVGVPIMVIKVAKTTPIAQNKAG